MMNTGKKILSRYALYITAFFIPFILMMIIFMIQSIYPFGDRSFLHIDMYHQYFPFLNEFYHKLKAFNIDKDNDEQLRDMDKNLSRLKKSLERRLKEIKN